MEPWEEYVTVSSPFNKVIVKEKLTQWTFWILLTKGVGSVSFVSNLSGSCHTILEDQLHLMSPAVSGKLEIM